MTPQQLCNFLTLEPKTVSEIAKAAGIKPQQCSTQLRALHRTGVVKLGTVMRGHSKAVNTYRLAEQDDRKLVQREEWRGSRLPLRYVPRETPLMTLSK